MCDSCYERSGLLAVDALIWSMSPKDEREFVEAMSKGLPVEMSKQDADKWDLQPPNPPGARA